MQRRQRMTKPGTPWPRRFHGPGTRPGTQWCGVAFACLALLAGGPAAAQTGADAAEFLRGLYARYGQDGSFSPFADLATVEAFATPGLVQLVRRDQQAASAAQDEGGLDADPVCGCQDSDGLRLAGLSVVPAGQGRATALATLRFGTATVRRRFLLVAVDGTWRIDDIADGAGHGSVRAALAQSIRDLLRERKR